MSVKTFAAIDVGSYETTMKIFEFSGKNKMRETDCICKRLDLGSDTYAHGKISKEKMDELCRTLKQFVEIMRSYKVEAYKAYGTSAIRETENVTIVQDQIAQRTGIKLELLSNSEQRFLDYKSVASKGESFRRIIEEKTAVVDIGGGSLQISLFDSDTLVSTQNLRLGVLRMQEMLQHLNAKAAKQEQLIDELATAQLTTYKKLYLKDREIHNIIIVDDYISPWAVKRMGKDGHKDTISATEFEELMQQIRSTYDELAAMGVPREDARYVLANATETKIVVTMNARSLMHFFNLRCCNRAQWEIRELAYKMLEQAKAAAPLLFKNAGASCVATGHCPEGAMTCGRFGEMIKRRTE